MYSKFDGFSTIEGIVQKAKDCKMPAVGLSDHGTIAGAIKMLKTCRKAKIKPILGMESYQARSRLIKNKQDGRKGNRHLNIFAKNFAGFRNLCKLSQRASLEGFYYNPRVDLELLEECREGLIISSACLSNLINANLLRDRYEEAKQAATIYKDIFGEDFYLEMMFHGLDSQARILPDIQKLSKELDIKTVITQDSHYLNKEDAETHEVLMCMSSSRCIKDPNHLKFPYGEFYFKTQEEMAITWRHAKQSMRNTLEVAEKCDYSDIVFIESGGTMKLPKFDVPSPFKDSREYIKHLAWEGLKKLGLHKSEPHKNRLATELADLQLVWDTKRYDFATYFLLVWDTMRASKEKHIAGGIRGSGVGALICLCLGISEGIDPIGDKHSPPLLWERVLGFEDRYFISENDVGMTEKTNAI